jgi:hypothetical protein
MLDALTKSLAAITAADLRELTERGWPESENVEYKAELHREQANRQDPWYSNGNVSEPSKKKIFKEIVAFANTSGGRLFLGIRETREKPPRAESIQPVPRCAELAERLEQAAINSIDPPLTFFHVTGIPTEPDGTSGVLIAEVSASYSGPHRSSDHECYARKGTNSVPMRMREIHDVVMRLSRRQDELQRRLVERKDLFERWMGRGSGTPNLQVGFRLTAIPVGAPLYLDQVFRNPAVSRGLSGVSGTWTDQAMPQPFYSPKRSLSENPVLGGTKWRSYSDDRGAAEKLILRDGLIDTWFKIPWEGQGGPKPLPLLQFQWIVALATNILTGIEAFRSATRAPNCEYALQLEWLSTNGPSDLGVQLVTFHSGFPGPLGSEFTTPSLPELYPVGDREKVINLIVRDVYDAAGVPESPPDLNIDWSTME